MIAAATHVLIVITRGRAKVTAEERVKGKEVKGKRNSNSYAQMPATNYQSLFLEPGS